MSRSLNTARSCAANVSTTSNVRPSGSPRTSDARRARCRVWAMMVVGRQCEEGFAMDVPETRFAVSRDGVRIAYQAFGSGPPLVAIPGLVSNVELSWEHELTRRVLEYESRFVRVLLFDKRGIGCSDRFEEFPTLEQRIEDISAVMDAEGLERASVLGISEGGVMSQLFAAMCPERVDRLVLVSTSPLDNQISTDDLYRDTEHGSVQGL